VSKSGVRGVLVLLYLRNTFTHKESLLHIQTNSHLQGKPCTSLELPIPDDLLTRLKSSEWKERYQGVTELEQFVDDNPAAIGSHVVKVSNTMTAMCVLILSTLSG